MSSNILADPLLLTSRGTLWRVGEGPLWAFNYEGEAAWLHSIRIYPV